MSIKSDNSIGIETVMVGFRFGGENKIPIVFVCRSGMVAGDETS